MHWPFRQPETARGVRRSALHDRLAARGACFGETAGWERPNWFAPDGRRAAIRIQLRAAELVRPFRRRAPRGARGGRPVRPVVVRQILLARGPDAEAVLNRICANDVAVPVGRVVYTQWLNERGGIEADLTVTREAETATSSSPSAASQIRDLAWLQRHIPADARAVAVDVTSGFARARRDGAARARAACRALTDADLSNAAFPFGTSQEIDLGYARVRASRITYVGELGWELYIPTEFAQDVFDRSWRKATAYGLTLAGYHAMNSLRMEKGYRALGPRHHRRGHAAGGRARLRRRLGQAGRLHRPRGAAAPTRSRRKAAPGAVRARAIRPSCCTTTSRSGATADWSAARPPACSVTPSANPLRLAMCLSPTVDTTRSKLPASASLPRQHSSRSTTLPAHGLEADQPANA